MAVTGSRAAAGPGESGSHRQVTGQAQAAVFAATGTVQAPWGQAGAAPMSSPRLECPVGSVVSARLCPPGVQ